MSIPSNFHDRYELRSGHSGRPSVFSKLTRRKLTIRTRDDSVMLDDGMGGRGHYKISDLVTGLLPDVTQEDDRCARDMGSSDLQDDDDDDVRNDAVRTYTLDHEDDSSTQEDGNVENNAAPMRSSQRVRNTLLSLSFISLCVGILWRMRGEAAQCSADHVRWAFQGMDAAYAVAVFRQAVQKWQGVIWGPTRA